MSKTPKYLQQFKDRSRTTARNAHGLTPKQEAFAQRVSRGEMLSEAYRATYATQDAKAQTVNGAASTLAKNPVVHARIEQLLREQEQSMHRDTVAIRRHVFAGLMQESRNDKARPSERIAALIALGKIDIVSMFRETSTIQHQIERKPEEIESELRSRLRELFRPD